MTTFVGLRVGVKAKTYLYLIGDCSHDKKGKTQKKCVIKISNCLEVTKLEDKINHPEKNKT